MNKKARLRDPVERPEAKKEQIEDRPASVADMHWGSALASLRT
ncbi:hypothetical protein [Brachybacterium endophyticum]|nr:hypothetical protein [Brachybacterium endophyticum]